jgi:SAM-dependent methyltransferase
VTPYVRILAVDEGGISLLVAGDLPIDVCFDGRRIWTFWTRRDTVRVPVPVPVVDRVVGAVRRHAAWPKVLLAHMDGSTRITVRQSAGDGEYYDREIRFGSSTSRIEVRNEEGVELGIDKSGRLVPTFQGRSEQNIDALLDATESVIEALRRAGLEPFLAYGTLLGAVREGRVLPHDSDADLGYVSRTHTPVDVIRESFRVQRLLAAEGWEISRYSGGAFKIDVVQGGVRTGLDVFGGFWDAGRLYLMGEIGTDFREEWVFPLGTAQLEGRPFPVPAEPERLLEATYGPSWRVPDPAFKFTTPDRTVRALDDWFRGTQPNIRYWARRANATRGKPLPRVSGIARRVSKLARELGAEVLDVGAGRGQDSLWLAQQGHPVTAYDYVPRALDEVSGIAQEQGLDLSVRYLNLAEWRSVLAEGARLAHSPRPRVVLARNTLEATSGVGRAALARFCSMAMREGGWLFSQTFLDEVGDDARRGTVGTFDPEAMTTLLREAGATRVTMLERTRGGRPVAIIRGAW